MRVRTRLTCVRAYVYAFIVSVNFPYREIGVHARSDSERVRDSRLLAGLYQMGAVALRPRSTSVAVSFVNRSQSSA